MNSFDFLTGINDIDEELLLSSLEFMEQEDHMKKFKKGASALSKMILVAAILGMLSATAYAAEYIFGAGDWFRGRMNEQLKEDQQMVEENDWNMTIQETVSQGQVDIANALGQNFKEQTITSNGTTMTMTAAYGDASVLNLYLKVEAPDGTVLPDGVLYRFYDPRQEDFEDQNGWRPMTSGTTYPYTQIAYNYATVTPLPDEDPTDNKKDFEIRLVSTTHFDEFVGMEPSDVRGAVFNDGTPKYLNITGLYEQVVNMDGDEDGYVPFATGDFSFNVGLINEAEIIKLDVEGLTYGGHKVRKWSHPEGVEGPLNGHYDWCPPYDENGVHTEEWDYSVTVRSLTMSPLSAYWELDFGTDKANYSCSLSWRVVMKDGTVAMKTEGGGFLGDADSSGASYFTTPLDFDQVAYIEIGDPDVCVPYRIELPR